MEEGGTWDRSRIITDTASDITRQRAEELDVIVVPISIKFGETEMPMESEEDFHRFFRRLAEEKELPTTSQPSPELYLKEYNEAKEKGEDVLVLTLSSGLSGTINAARLAKDMCGCDRIFIVDTRQAIIPQQMLVEYAVRQRAQGVGAEEIAEKIVDVRDRMVVCGVLDALDLSAGKGGRIPPEFDVLGNVLKIKPVIELKDGILVKLGVARGMRKGKDYLLPGIRGLRDRRRVAGSDRLYLMTEKAAKSSARKYRSGITWQNVRFGRWVA